jgi:hypothetical protein
LLGSDLVLPHIVDRTSAFKIVNNIFNPKGQHQPTIIFRSWNPWTLMKLATTIMVIRQTTVELVEIVRSLLMLVAV